MPDEKQPHAASIEQAQLDAGIDRTRVNAMATTFRMTCDSVTTEPVKAGERLLRYEKVPCKSSFGEIDVETALKMAEHQGFTEDEEIKGFLLSVLRDNATKQGWTYTPDTGDRCPACSQRLTITPMKTPRTLKKAD